MNTIFHQLRDLETIISTSQKWQIAEAQALQAIRAKRLYRKTHSTFEEYIAQRWQMDRTYAYRLCQWAEVIAAVSPIGDIPKRESHARPLVGLPAAQKRTVWKTVVKRLGGSRTAAEIESIVTDHLCRQKPQKATGTQPRSSGTVVCGDAIESVKTLDNGSVDLCFFSPPYCEQRSRQFPGFSEEEFPHYMTRLFAALQPKMAERGSLMMNARAHVRNGEISDYLFRTRLAIRAAGWKEIETLIWHKPDAPPRGRVDRPRRTYDFVFWFSMTSSPFIDTKAAGRPSSSRKVRIGRESKDGYSDSSRAPYRSAAVARVSDVILAPVGGGGADGVQHCAMFPLSLANQIIRTYCPLDGLVADPMCGSGQTLIAARDAGRRWWGSDIMPKFVRMSQNRMSI